MPHDTGFVDGGRDMPQDTGFVGGGRYMPHDTGFVGGAETCPMTLGMFLPDVCFNSNNFVVLAEVCPLLSTILVGNVFYILIARWFGTLFFSYIST